MLADDDGGAVPSCHYCATHCALLHCAQHSTGLLCPLCDAVVSVPAATPHAHDGGAPLCETCHANHGVSLCTPCALAVWYSAEFPDPADLELPPTMALQEPPETCLDDLVNAELLALAPHLSISGSRSSDEQGTIMNEVPSSSLTPTGGNIESHVATGEPAAAPTGGGEGDVDLFTLDDFDWSLGDADGAGGFATST